VYPLGDLHALVFDGKIAKEKISTPQGYYSSGRNGSFLVWPLSNNAQRVRWKCFWGLSGFYKTQPRASRPCSVSNNIYFYVPISTTEYWVLYVYVWRVWVCVYNDRENDRKVVFLFSKCPQQSRPLWWENIKNHRQFKWLLFSFSSALDIEF